MKMQELGPPLLLNVYYDRHFFCNFVPNSNLNNLLNEKT
jgi:hypothetical protein